MASEHYFSSAPGSDLKLRQITVKIAGAIREASGPFELMSHCHCSMCRKVHGTGYATFVAAPESEH